MTLAKSHLGFLSRAEDLGPVESDRRLDRLVLVLKRTPEQERALRALLDSQQTRGSKNYHAWMTPEEFGQRFGPAGEDVAKISAWLSQRGFQVEGAAKGGMEIEFSGTVGQVNAAFGTQMRRYRINGETHMANATDVSVPSAIAGLVEGAPLHDFFSKPMVVRAKAGGPQITAPWNTAITAIVPGDFWTIYDLSPLYKAGLNGSGQTIAILAEADIALSDVATFQKTFGVTSNVPKVIEAGADPGVDLSDGYGEEATLDTEWASAIAPGATIELVVGSPAGATDPIALAALYAVDHNLAQIISVSFGECEQDLGIAGNAMWNSLWEQAAAQGTSVFVASGDAGSVMCNASGFNLETGYGPMAVNGMASTAFNTAVGGTEFNEGVNGGRASTYWSTTNASNLASATGYIPEMVWNDSCGDLNNIYSSEECSSNLPSLAASGGGVSTLYATPSWQTLNIPGLQAQAGYSLPNQTGVSPRGVPDVALPASAAHDGYLFCFTRKSATPDCQLVNGAVTQTTFQNEAGGTSFGTPAFAGIMAIVNQQEKSVNASSAGDGRQGLANYVLYPLAVAESYSACDSSSRTDPTKSAPTGCTFNDITFGNNGPPQSYTFAPGVTGYSAALGFDLDTGLGSVDAKNLVTNWTAAAAGFHASATTLTANSGTGPVSIQHGQPVEFDVTVQRLSGDATTQAPAGNVSILGQGGSLAGSFGVAIAPLTGGSDGTSSTGSFASGSMPAGNYNVVANFPGDGFFGLSASAAIPVTVTPENSVTTLQVYGYQERYGEPTILSAQVAGASGNGYTSGTVNFYDGATLLAQAALSSNGQAVLNNCPGNANFFPAWSALPCFGVGTHMFSAIYSGDASFNPSPTPPASSQVATVTISKGVAYFPLIGARPNDTSGAIGGTYTLDASVLSPLGTTQPTGTVQFFLNGAALGTETLAGNPPTASVANVSLPQGSFTLSANYSGDANYQSASLVEPNSIGVPLGWLAPTTTQTINPGQTATFNLTLSNATYSGDAPIGCVSGTNPNQPTKAPPGVVCSVTPGSATFTAGGQTTPVTVTITTTALSRTAPQHFPGVPWTLPPVLALAFWWRRGRRGRRWIGCVLIGAAVCCMASCGGGGSSSSNNPPPPPATTAVFTVFAQTTVTKNDETDTGDTVVTLTVKINP